MTQSNTAGAPSFVDKELMAKLSRPTMPLIEAGDLCFGLGPSATRAAARNGEIPAFNIGRTALVRTAWLRQKIGLDVEAA